MCLMFVCLCDCVLVAVTPTKTCRSTDVRKVIWLKFLVTVNDTWDPDGCIATVLTPRLIPGKEYNKSESVRVGRCDKGPLWFNISEAGIKESHAMNVDLIFFSSVVEDASPPTCRIPWNGTYLTPKTTMANESLLPGCFVMDSREGYHMTYYWFHVIDWMFG
uniref:Uncharacterized protein LOC100370662 n=1 Tax=Saccoglossus kowalevskii TaxID=10224 RepID=A0ABM0GRW1_SACKO|nr:PREDICTED: uncharacterized protein LOC100370662 [Saccoglossus kowalevskii]